MNRFCRISRALTGALLAVRAVRAADVAIENAGFVQSVAIPDYADISGIILPHEGSDAPLSAFCATVDQVEVATGLDFCSAPTPDVQSNLESRVSHLLWPVESTSTKRP